MSEHVPEDISPLINELDRQIDYIGTQNRLSARITELEAALEHAERALSAENLKGYDEGFRIAEQMSTREVNDLRTRLAEADKSVEAWAAKFAEMQTIAEDRWRLMIEAEQRGRALERALSYFPGHILCAFVPDEIRAALSAPPPGVDKPAATMLGEPISMDELKRISKDGP